MSNIWFTSDTHYDHINICRSVSKWVDKTFTRDFPTLEKMNWGIVNSINSVVDENDDLYHLGDWSFNGIENIWKFRQRINCKNIHLILGNHDDHIKKNIVLPNVVSTEPYSSVFIDGRNLDKEHSNYVVAQRLFSSVSNYLELHVKKEIYVLSHYPIEQWYEMDRGSIHLHGHMHHKLDNGILNTNYRRMDVGIDWKCFRPFSLSEINHKMFSKDIFKHSNDKKI